MKGELKMDKMNLFDKSKTIATLPEAPIQDEEGNLTFTLNGKTFSLNVNSEEVRERIKEEVNANSLAKYDWFEEKTGARHWVLYDTLMYYPAIDEFHEYDEEYDEDYNPEDNEYDFLAYHYLGDTKVVPVMPINATSCFRMFAKFHGGVTSIDFSKFNTCNIEDMSSMFAESKHLVSLDLSNFNMENVKALYYMFRGCISLSNLVISNWSLNKVQKLYYMFEMCISLKKLDLSNWKLNTTLKVDAFGTFYACTLLSELKVNKDFLKSITAYNDADTFTLCHSLPNFSTNKTVIELFKPVEEGGCLTVVK